ncbi:unnamed protein product, partial [marine sediment metagenome]
ATVPKITLGLWDWVFGTVTREIVGMRNGLG